MADEKKRVELPTLDEIDAELAGIAERRKWLLQVRRLVAKLGPADGAEPEPEAE